MWWLLQAVIDMYLIWCNFCDEDISVCHFIMLEIFSFEECYASYFCSSPYYSKTPYNWNVFLGQMMSAVVAHMWLAVSDLACRLMFAKSVHTECFAPVHRGWWTDAQDEHVRSGYLLNNWCCDYWNSPSVCKLRVVLFGSAAMWVSLTSIAYW